MRKPILYMLCGIPASGKTTWANVFIASREIYNIDIHYVSRDEIRFTILKDGEDYFAHEDEVFNKFVDTIYATLADGFDVIADATHLNKKSRTKLINAIDKCGEIEYNIIFVWFHASFIVCSDRNAKREGRARVPLETMYSMWHHFSIPSSKEDSRCIEVWEVGE